MQGKTVLITGATNGIGKEAALVLAGMGARVGIVGRSQARTEETATEIRNAVNGAQIDVFISDLSLLRDVRALAEAVKAKYTKLDVLLNNAGALFMTRQETAEGHEMTFALNHLNYFLLTHLLLDAVKAASSGRIVNVASDAHTGQTLNFDDLEMKQTYSGFACYGRSKLMNIMFTYELDRRLRAAGTTNVTANCLHPGFVRTGFGQNNGSIVKFVVNVMGQLAAITPQEGAKTSVYLASSPEVDGVSGKYFAKSKAKQSSKVSYDEADQKRLWEISETLALKPA
jgi:retinol dehydrogenase 12